MTPRRRATSWRVIRGSDPKLRGEYVALGAHNDHVGVGTQAVDHDSLHLYNEARYAIRGMVARGQQATRGAGRRRRGDPHQLRQRPRGASPSGSTRSATAPTTMDLVRVTLLELAEAFQKAPVKPKRSLVFVWHVGEEKGLLGSRWYSDHPTVPRDSIVAQLNMDMVGRGDDDRIFPWAVRPTCSSSAPAACRRSLATSWRR